MKSRPARSNKTASEALFEAFCLNHCLLFERIEEGVAPTPDYLVMLNGIATYVEIKQIDKDEAFMPPRMTRTLGNHLRAKIDQARNQVRPAAFQGAPAILLVYNNLDPLQLFGTEQQDFVAAMYGEPTVSVSVATGEIVDSFNGRNQSLRLGKNDSFSAIGHLRREPSGPTVRLYENLYAKVPLDYATLPACLPYNRVELAGNGTA